VETLDDHPTPASAEHARPITLVPPPAEPSAVHPLPFRPAPEAVDDDGELTPPRGYPAVTDLRTEIADPPGVPRPGLGRFGTIRPEPAEPDPAERYAALRLAIWRSEAPLAEVLARHGVDDAAFRALEGAQREAIAREAEEGGSRLAIALLDELARAGT
jgi:hypothetical protein